MRLDLSLATQTTQKLGRILLLGMPASCTHGIIISLFLALCQHNYRLSLNLILDLSFLFLFCKIV